MNEIVKLRPDIKTLFVSGYTGGLLDVDNTKDDRINLLLKPVRPKDLLCKTREILDEQKNNMSV